TEAPLPNEFGELGVQLDTHPLATRALLGVLIVFFYGKE
ncbi:unnamed protein product, partial [Rotaria magnacalcarata]